MKIENLVFGCNGSSWPWKWLECRLKVISGTDFLSILSEIQVEVLHTSRRKSKICLILMALENSTYIPIYASYIIIHTMLLITTQKQSTECKKSTAPEVARRRVEQIGQAHQLRLHLGMLELEYALSFLLLEIDCPMPLHLCHSSASHNNSPCGFHHTY